MVIFHNFFATCATWHPMEVYRFLPTLKMIDGEIEKYAARLDPKKHCSVSEFIAGVIHFLKDTITPQRLTNEAGLSSFRTSKLMKQLLNYYPENINISAIPNHKKASCEQIAEMLQKYGNTHFPEKRADYLSKKYYLKKLFNAIQKSGETHAIRSEENFRKFMDLVNNFLAVIPYYTTGISPVTEEKDTAIYESLVSLVQDTFGMKELKKIPYQSITQGEYLEYDQDQTLFDILSTDSSYVEDLFIPALYEKLAKKYEGKDLLKSMQPEDFTEAAQELDKSRFAGMGYVVPEKLKKALLKEMERNHLLDTPEADQALVNRLLKPAKSQEKTVEVDKQEGTEKIQALQDAILSSQTRQLLAEQDLRASASKEYSNKCRRLEEQVSELNGRLAEVFRWDPEVTKPAEIEKLLEKENATAAAMENHSKNPGETTGTIFQQILASNMPGLYPKKTVMEKEADGLKQTVQEIKALQTKYSKYLDE